MSLPTPQMLEAWAENAQKGLLCAILGCNEPVDVHCSKCTFSYCKKHKTFHFHSLKKS